MELIDDAAIFELSTMGGVREIAPVYKPQTNAGSVESRAPIAMKSDMARNLYGLDGSGQKVGVISDSFNTTSGVRDADTFPPAGQPGILRNAKNQKSGDLPAQVEILEDIPSGIDEGAGMAELIYDIAPGAAMAFHTGFISQQNFADGIQDLANAGSTVIVDDIIWFAEPMFQHGLIAQSARDVVRAGIPYYSSAGNNANVSFRMTYNDAVPGTDDMAFPPTGNDFHVWPNGRRFLPITVTPAYS